MCSLIETDILIYFSGQLGASSGTKHTLTNLLRKMKSRFPSSKHNEVLNLYGSVIVSSFNKIFLYIFILIIMLQH